MLICKYDINKSIYFKAKEKLFNKKKELFKIKNYEKWNINLFEFEKANKNELINNKVYAFKYMLY